jgi:hypothetical protein
MVKNKSNIFKFFGQERKFIENFLISFYFFVNDSENLIVGGGFENLV